MKNIIILTFSLLALCSFENLAFSIPDRTQKHEDQLVAVVVIFRHGDRSPLKSFPEDYYFNISYWPMGFGHLTAQGIQRQYKLGQWLRERYNGFLSNVYSPQEIFVQSAKLDRCQMSALANLAGLYPPTDFQVWNEHIPWQPIPVHMGYEYNIMKKHCPKYDKLYKHANNFVIGHFEEKYSDIFRNISEHTGWKNVTVNEISTLGGTIHMYKSYNTSFLPEWTQRLNHSIINYIRGVKFALATSTSTLTRLRIGTFYNYILGFFDRYTNGTTKKMYSKFMMMSSRDTTLTSILNGMCIYEMRPVGFGDTLIMELKRKSNGSYFLNFYYKFDESLEKLTVVNCGFDCDYEKLKRILKNVTIDKHTRKVECNEEVKEEDRMENVFNKCQMMNINN